MGKSKGLSRRGMLRSTAAAGVFMIVPRHVLGGEGHTPPSETVYLASVGAGGRAGHDIHACARAGARIAALCDVDDRRAAETYKKYPDASRYRDFREMLDKEKGIDGVIVGTPDHTHAVAALDAMRRGKHVYLEKPLAHSVPEVRALMKAAKESGVATQLGNQGHSSEHMRLFREWVDDGAIGTVREVDAFCGGVYSYIDKLPQLEEKHEVPEGLDWDLWLGPAQSRPYHPLYLPSNWRRWKAFGTGVIGDWVCHVIDPVFWTLNLGAPDTVLAEPVGFDVKRHGETFPPGSIVRYSFPARGTRPAVKLTWYDGEQKPPRPAELEADRKLPGTGAVVTGDTGKIMYGSHGAGSCIIIPNDKFLAYERPEKTLTRSPGHHKEWLMACKGELPDGDSNFAYGGPLTEIALIGAVAIRLAGETLRWDGDAGRFIGNDRANLLLHAPYRAGWRL